MAQRRMFSLSVVDTDRFLDMPQSTQNLYFHLGMRADDEGFVSSPRKIIKIIGAGNDDLKLLITKGYIIPFDSGVCVITDWNLNNYLQKDRCKETVYTVEKSLLQKQKNGSYALCIHGGYELETQYSIVQSRVAEEDGAYAPTPTHVNVPKDIRHQRGEFGWVKLSDNEYQRLISEYGERVANFYIRYIDESAQQTGNKNKWKDWNLTVRKAIRGKWGGEPQREGRWRDLD